MVADYPIFGVQLLATLDERWHKQGVGGLCTEAWREEHPTEWEQGWILLGKSCCLWHSCITSIM